MPFTLLYYFGFLLTTVALKSNRGGIVYLLAFCLTSRHTFYFAIAEIPFGILITVILYAMIEYFLNQGNKRKQLVFILSFSVVFGLYYFHQLMLIAILFVLLVVYFSHKEYKNLKIISLFAFTLFWFGANIVLLSNDSYEAKKIPGIDVFVQELPHFFDLPSFKYFFIHFKKELLIPFIVSLIGFSILIFKRKFFLLTLFVAVPLAYFVLIIITYSKGEAPNMYQLYYVIFGLFLALLINSSRTTKISNNYLIYLVIPLLLYSSQRIYATHYLPTKRVEYISLLAKHGKKVKNRKYIIHPDDFPWGYAWVTWAIPSEVLLISSLENKKNGVVCYVPNFGEVVDISANGGQLLGAPWQQYLLKTTVLDTNYFNIPTTTDYLLMNRITRSENYYKAQIKYNLEWRDQEEEKARERGISLEEMIQISADSLIAASKKEKLEKVKVMPKL